MPGRRLLIKTLVFCLSLLLLPGLSFAQAKPTKQVILLMADYLTIADLQSFSKYFAQDVVSSGTVGLMNTTTGGASRVSPHTQVTISSGQPALGSNSSVLALEAGEPVNDELAQTVFQRYTGLLPEENGIVILNWPQIIRANETKGVSPPIPGSLGTRIQEAGLSVAVYGNSDTPKGEHRPAVLLASNRDGMAPTGVVGEEILRAADGLLSRKTDYRKLLDLTLAALPVTDFIIVDFGDLYRLDAISHYGFVQVVEAERQAIIKDMANYYHQICKAVDLENTLIILASTTPSPAQIKQKNYLVPVLMSGSKLPPGLLYSNTTRRPGLITNTDLTASILSFLEVEPIPAMTGQPVTGVKLTGKAPLTFLEDMNKRMVFTYQIRSSIIKPYIALQIITIAMSLPLLFTLKKFIPLYQLWLVLLVSYPGALLLVGVFANLGLTAYVIISILLALLLTGLCVRFAGRYPAGPFVLLSIVTACLISADLISGSFFMKQSVLGYDPIAGARYYGIGNEYMGILIGASFFGFGVLLKAKDSPLLSALAVLYFGSLVWLMFANNFGANLGGTVSLLVAFSYWLWRWHKVFLKKNWLYLLPLITVFLLLVFAAGVSLNPDSPSHIGRTVNLIQDQGLQELTDIISRKVKMNIKLIRYTPWSRVFLLALLAIGILFYRPTGFLQRLHNRYRSIYEASLAIIIGSFTALIWNDSGIVAAATAMIFGVYPLISLSLQEPSSTTLPYRKLE